MPQCNNCEKPADVGRVFCDTCLNDWMKMREVVKDALKEIHGIVTRLNMEMIQRETLRLENIWKRNRKQFENEARRWF